MGTDFQGLFAQLKIIGEPKKKITCMLLHVISDYKHHVI